jgi:hypothetical protein
LLYTLRGERAAGVSLGYNIIECHCVSF